MKRSIVTDYFETLSALPQRAEVTVPDGRQISLDKFYRYMTRLLRGMRDSGSKLMFAGNGGSASIASHMVIDFSKNAGIPALSFNDGVIMSALSNDEGYDEAFARQIGFYANPDDLLIAISSSGNSMNILNAVAAAREKDCHVITMSGFKPNNPLRLLGDFNLYVPSGEYGFVEIAHLSLCHALVDLTMGWTAADGLWSKPEQDSATTSETADKSADERTGERKVA